MPDIPVTSPLSYVGVFLLLLGFFLVLAGLGILTIEKVTVKPGAKTWGFGIIMAMLGTSLLLLDIWDLLPKIITPTPTVVATATLTVASIPPTGTPLARPSNTPEPEPPVNTPTTEHLSTPTVVQVSPEQVIRDYYSAINNHQYEEAWIMLSDDFKEGFMSCSRYDRYYDCDEYMKWWPSVAQVNVGEVMVLRQDSNTATVFAQLSYLMKDESLVADTRPYIQLRFDATTRTWLIYDKGEKP